MFSSLLHAAVWSGLTSMGLAHIVIMAASSYEQLPNCIQRMPCACIHSTTLALTVFCSSSKMMFEAPEGGDVRDVPLTDEHSTCSYLLHLDLFVDLCVNHHVF